eukprot:479889-Rhodomonas_salina.4
MATSSGNSTGTTSLCVWCYATHLCARYAKPGTDIAYGATAAASARARALWAKATWYVLCASA